MTPEELYGLGYEHGKAGKSVAATHMTDENYLLGYEDGKGDRKLEKPSEDEYAELNDPPEGFKFGSKAVPLPYEFYLSKGGSATYLTRARKNNQTRHVLTCAHCGKSDARECWHHTNIKGRS